MNHHQYQTHIIEWRNFLIHAWSFSCRGSDADCAYMLLNEAIKRDFTARDSLKGSTMKAWPKQGTSPVWACKAAFYLLLEGGYVPNKDETLAAFVFYWLSENNVTSVESALNDFPEYLFSVQGDRIRYWIEVFFTR